MFFIYSFTGFIPSATFWVVSCHNVICQDILSTIRCSSWVTLPGRMIVGSLVLGFMHIMWLPLISFSIWARCFSSSLIDSFRCSLLLSKANLPDHWYRWWGVPLARPLLPVVQFPLGNLQISLILLARISPVPVHHQELGFPTSGLEWNTSDGFWLQDTLPAW